MEQNASPKTSGINQNHANWFYFFNCASIFIYSISFSNFWKQANYFQLVVLAINIVFIFTPLWKKIFNYNMTTNKKVSTRLYIFLYVMQTIFLVSQIGAFIKTYY